MSKKIFKLSILLIICSIFLSACTFNLPWKKKTASTNQDQTSLNGQSATSSETVFTKQLKKFIDNNDLKTFLQNHSNVGNFSYNDSINFVSSSPLASYRADSTDSSAPDIVKTNADYTYSLVRNDLIILKTNPASEAKIINRISFESRPQNILVSGNSLVVYGVDNKIVSESLFKKFRRQNSYTYLKVYDISDPLNPKLVRDLNFEGTYNSARLVGDYVYFLTNTPGSYFDGEPLLPRVLNNNEVLSPACADDNTSCFAPEVFYFDITYNSFNFLNITALNIKNNNEAISGQVYLLDNNQNIYVSPNNIYITYTSTINEYSLEQAAKRELIYAKLNVEDQDKINKIETSPDYILNNDEKKLKVGNVIDNYIESLTSDDQLILQAEIDQSITKKTEEQAKEIGKTSIYRFSMGSKVAYEALGEINGQVIDNYSIDENGGYLRVATVLEQNSLADSNKSNDFYSNLYILDKDLKLVGSLENLATTNEIKAARFTGNRVYFSTDKSDDPLYVIGLSDLAKPSVLGAIKVPGTYNYLLPFDSNGNKLISFGKDVSSNNKGLKLSLFDFIDLQKPKELDNYTIGDETSDSIALRDIKTFRYFYSDTQKLLLIPAALQDKGNLSFAGVLVFSLVDNRLIQKGKIDHSYGGHFTAVDSTNGFDYHDNTVKRSFYSNDSSDVIYTFSNKLLKINKLADLSSVKDVILTPGNDDINITQPLINSNSSSTPLSSDDLAPGEVANNATPSGTIDNSVIPNQLESSTEPAI